jgi:hypothetical protein
MAFSYVTYKNFAPINQIKDNLTNSEGCGVYLSAEGEVSIATSTTDIPYGLVMVGADSITPGTYPSAPVAGSLEIVDQLGVAVQVLASDAGPIDVGNLIIIDSAASVPGSFKAFTPTDGDYCWGMALTNCAAGEQFIMRFQPYLAVVPAPVPAP